MSVTAFFVQKMGDLSPLKFVEGILFSWLKAEVSGKCSLPTPPIPFMPLVWGQRLVLGLRNFSLGFTEKSTNLPKKRKHSTARNQLKCLSVLMYVFLRYRI